MQLHKASYYDELMYLNVQTFILNLYLTENNKE